MSYQHDQPESVQQLFQAFEQASRWIQHHLARILPLAAGAILLLWLASGVYTVNPGHKGVVRTFGKETARTDPGLNYRYPLAVPARGHCQRRTDPPHRSRLPW